MTAQIIPIATRRPVNRRLLAAAKAALTVLATMPLDDLMEGRDEPVRAELMAAIAEAEKADG